MINKLIILIIIFFCDMVKYETGRRGATQIRGINELNANEKLARKITGIESEATYNVVSDEAADEVLAKEKAAKFNQEVGDLQDRFQKHVDEIRSIGEEMSKDLNGIEIMPLGSYALISPYPANPFQKITVNKSGLITDLGGMTPTYKSQETGDMEEEVQYVKVGMVMETGMDCKFVKEGDVVFYNIASEVAVPFFKFGFVVVAEQRIIAVVNEKLTERKNILNK